MKRVISMVLALMLVLGLATTAFAAENVVNETDHDYEAYQIFTGSQSDASPSLGNVQWGRGIDGEAFLAALKEANDNYDTFNTAQGVAEYLAMDSVATPRQEDARQFAAIAVDYLTNFCTEIPAGATSVELDPGYYLLLDVTDVDGETDAKNPALLQVTNLGDVRISKKYNVPTSDKKILQDGTNVELTTDEKSVGDTVAFKLTGTLPNNLANYKTYRYVFHDHLSDGLTFDGVETIIVKINGVKIPASVADDPETEANEEKTNYVVKLNPVHEDGHECSFEIIFDDIKAVEGAVAGATVSVTYTATVNEDAKIFTESNPNTMHLEFSNDPNWEGDGSDSVPPTGETPDKTVDVYTTDIQITKKDGKGNILTGAAFRITGDSANVVLTEGDVFVPYVAAPEGSEQPVKYWKLTDGTYTTTDPATEGIETAGYVPPVDGVYATYMKTSYAALDTKNETNPVEAEAFVDENGIIKFKGLGVGTYTIKEIVTPKGYNTIGDLTLEIKWEDPESDGNYAFTYTWTGPVNSTSNSIIVNNTQGSTLPETGGIGTTIFYIIGGLMVAASAVLLVTKKRMTAE